MLGHAPYHQQPSPQLQHQQPAPLPTADPNVLHHQPPQPAHPQPPGTFQTLRLRDDPPAVTQPAPRSSRKRKSPSSANPDPAQAPMPPPGMQPPQQVMHHSLPPPHALVHQPPHLGGPPMPHYQYPPTDYTPGGMPPPPPHPQGPPPGHPIPPMQGEEQSPGGSSAGRTLSQSKRAEQNRKAQRAFRERRDQHVKALESRSQLLDAALASADEANRRWEECRALVDQLRIENAALRAALNQAQTQMMNGNPGANGNNVMIQQGGMSEQEQERNDDGKNDGVSAGGDGDKRE